MANLVIRQSLRHNDAPRRATALRDSLGEAGITALVRLYRRLRAQKLVQLFRAGAANFPYGQTSSRCVGNRAEIGL